MVYALNGAIDIGMALTGAQLSTFSSGMDGLMLIVAAIAFWTTDPK